MTVVADHSETAVVDTLDGLLAEGRRFRCVYVDPPWRYTNGGTRGAAAGHYKTLSLDAIAALPVAQLAQDDSHLHLWTTNAFLFEARSVMESWGFVFKSCLIWCKPSMGLGNYWRLAHEFLLFGMRGHLPFRDHSQSSWVEADRGIHSRKPWPVRRRIERVSPGPYLELFGRELVEGWTVFGNEVAEDVLPFGLPA